MSLDLSDLSSCDSDAGEIQETAPPNTYKLALEEVSYNRDISSIHIPLHRQKQLVDVDTGRRRKNTKEKKIKNRRSKGGVLDEGMASAIDTNHRRDFQNQQSKSSNVKILSHKNMAEKRAHRSDSSGTNDAFVHRDVYIDPNFNSTNITETSSSVFSLNVNAQEFIPKFNFK